MANNVEESKQQQEVNTATAQADQQVTAEKIASPTEQQKQPIVSEVDAGTGESIKINSYFCQYLKRPDLFL